MWCSAKEGTLSWCFPLMFIAQMTASVSGQSLIVRNFPQPLCTHLLMGSLRGAATFALHGPLTSAVVMVSHHTLVMGKTETSFSTQGRETPYLQQIFGKWLMACWINTNEIHVVIHPFKQKLLSKSGTKAGASLTWAPFRGLESKGVHSEHCDSMGGFPSLFCVFSLHVNHSKSVLTPSSFVCFIHVASDRVNLALKLC